MATWYWRRVIRHFMILVSLLIIFSCTTLIDFYIDRSEKVDYSTFKPIKGLRLVDKETLFSKLCFSKKKNTIILLVDTLDTLTFEKTLDTYPDLKEIFAGFWMFRENLGTGGLTFFALPQILSGHIYNDNESFSELAQNALVGQESMAADALYRGYKAFIDHETIFSMTGESLSQSEDNEDIRISLKEYFSIFTFRFYPYLGKYLAVEIVNFKNRDTDSYLALGDDANKKKFNRLISRMKMVCTDEVLQFIHFFGVHAHLIKDNIIDTTNEYFHDFAVFLDALKKFDLFNNTTIIVMADHGSYFDDYRNWYPERKGTQPTKFFPLLMIKTPESEGNLVIRNDLISSSYVRLLVREFYEKGDNNEVMENFLANLPSVRYLYEPGVGNFEAFGTFSTMKLKKIEHKK